MKLALKGLKCSYLEYLFIILVSNWSVRYKLSLHTNNVNPDMKNWSKLPENNHFCHFSCEARPKMLPLIIEMNDFNSSFLFQLYQMFNFIFMLESSYVPIIVVQLLYINRTEVKTWKITIFTFFWFIWGWHFDPNFQQLWCGIIVYLVCIGIKCQQRYL